MKTVERIISENSQTKDEEFDEWLIRVGKIVRLQYGTTLYLAIQQSITVYFGVLADRPFDLWEQQQINAGMSPYSIRRMIINACQQMRDYWLMKLNRRHTPDTSYFTDVP